MGATPPTTAGPRTPSRRKHTAAATSNSSVGATGDHAGSRGMAVHAHRFISTACFTLDWRGTRVAEGRWREGVVRTVQRRVAPRPPPPPPHVYSPLLNS